MKKIFCFGELLLRMSPVLKRQWIYDEVIPVYIGGSELNVATALAGWGVPVQFVTALPDHYLSDEIIEELQARRIDTSAIHRLGNRIGTYYLPHGADLKGSGVIYDRAWSSFSELKPGIINWNEVLKECGWFHFSAISPALNENLAAVCHEALLAASKMGLIISIDLNFRAQLWRFNKTPKEIMHELVHHCDIIMGNIWAAESLLGIEALIKESTGKSQKQLADAAAESIMQLQLLYPKATALAYTFRQPNDYWAVLQHTRSMVTSRIYSVPGVVDKAGSGDCFMAGLIYGLNMKHAPTEIINFAAAAAVGKLQEKGDATRQTIEQINTRIL